MDPQSRTFSGKVDDDRTTALAAMVRNYPPDWSRAQVWTRVDGRRSVSVTVLGGVPSRANGEGMIVTRYDYC